MHHYLKEQQLQFEMREKRVARSWKMPAITQNSVQLSNVTKNTSFTIFENISLFERCNNITSSFKQGVAYPLRHDGGQEVANRREGLIASCSPSNIVGYATPFLQKLLHCLIALVGYVVPSKQKLMMSKTYHRRAKTHGNEYFFH